MLWNSKVGLLRYLDGVIRIQNRDCVKNILVAAKDNQCLNHIF